MPPKAVFTQDDVITAAMAVVTRSGFQELSVRKIAEEMGSSPQPIYSCFASKREIEQTVVERIKTILSGYTTKTYTGSRPLDMAIGFVLFSRDHTQLFRSLFLQKNEFENIFEKFIREHIQRMESLERYALLSADERRKILKRLWIFAYGFATLMSAGIVHDSSLSSIITTLREAGLLMTQDVPDAAGGEQVVSS